MAWGSCAAIVTVGGFPFPLVFCRLCFHSNPQVSEKLKTNPEDEAFEHKAAFTATFALPKLDENVGHKQYRTVMLIPAAHMPAVVAAVDELIPTDASKIQSL